MRAIAERGEFVACQLLDVGVTGGTERVLIDAARRVHVNDKKRRIGTYSSWQRTGFTFFPRVRSGEAFV